MGGAASFKLLFLSSRGRTESVASNKTLSSHGEVLLCFCQTAVVVGRRPVIIVGRGGRRYFRQAIVIVGSDGMRYFARAVVILKRGKRLASLGPSSSHTCQAVISRSSCIRCCFPRAAVLVASEGRNCFRQEMVAAGCRAVIGSSGEKKISH